MTSNKKSSISLLKIVAIILIIMSHVTPDFDKSSSISFISSISATMELGGLYVIFSKYLGQLGVCIFVVCSSYFLADREYVRKEKVINLEIDAIIVGIICGIFCYLISPYPILSKNTLSILMPISVGSNWFVACYILYYLSVPLLNKSVSGRSKRELLKLCIILFLIYSFAQMVFKDRYYSNHLIGFICIHYFTLYYKRFVRNENKVSKRSCITFITAFLLLIVLVFCLNYAGLHITFLKDKMQHFRMFMNPLILICAFSLLDFSLNYVYVNKSLDFIASLTFYIYMFHENDIIKNTLRPILFGIAYEHGLYSNIILLCFLGSVLTFIISVLFSTLYYYSIGMITSRFSCKIKSVLSKAINDICEMIQFK